MLAIGAARAAPASAKTDQCPARPVAEHSAADHDRQEEPSTGTICNQTMGDPAEKQRRKHRACSGEEQLELNDITPDAFRHLPDPRFEQLLPFRLEHAACSCHWEA